MTNQEPLLKMAGALVNSTCGAVSTFYIPSSLGRYHMFTEGTIGGSKWVFNVWTWHLGPQLLFFVRPESLMGNPPIITYTTVVSRIAFVSTTAVYAIPPPRVVCVGYRAVNNQVGDVQARSCINGTNSPGLRYRIGKASPGCAHYAAWNPCWPASHQAWNTHTCH